jgi:signal transduction histidine kinase
MRVGTAEFQGREVVVAAVQDRTSEIRLQKAGREYAERLEEAVGERTEALERTNRELRKVQSRLVQAERLGVAGEMVGGIAHAIYNPMTALIGTLQMRLEGRRRPYPGDESILRLARRIKSIVEKMLALSRRGEMNSEPADLSQLIRDLREELAERCSSNGVEIEARFEPDLPLVMLDRTLLTTALAGIAENAVDAMPDGGKLRLDVERGSGAEAVRVRVRDTGPGIPEDIQAQIFQPFFSTKPSGVGLGLAIARGVILGHEGSLQVDSKLGVGTEVSIEIPVRGVRASLRASKEKPAAVRARA